MGENPTGVRWEEGWAGDGKGPPRQEQPEASMRADCPGLWEEAGVRQGPGPHHSLSSDPVLASPVFLPMG